MGPSCSVPKLLLTMPPKLCPAFYRMLIIPDIIIVKCLQAMTNSSIHFLMSITLPAPPPPNHHHKKFCLLFRPTPIQLISMVLGNAE